MLGGDDRSALARADAVDALLGGEPRSLAAFRELVLSVLSSHSPALRPWWPDLVSEVLVGTLRALRGGTRIRDLEGFIARIAYCRAIDLARSLEKGRSARSELAAAARPADVPEPADPLAVQELLEAAPPPYPRIWELVFFEQRTHRAAAEALGLPLATFHDRLRESLRWAADWMRRPPARTRET